MADQEVENEVGDIYFTGDDVDTWIKVHFLANPGQRYCIQCGVFSWASTGPSRSHTIVSSYEEYLAHLPEIVMLRLKGE